MFQPPWWLSGPHLQTLWQPFVRKGGAIIRRRQRIDTPDGDFLDLDWYAEQHQPLVVLLHGLTGSSHSPYIEGLQLALGDHGFRSVALNFRGCSGSPNQTWKAYHSGDTSDLDYLLQSLKSQEPETEIMAVGFSLGGNVLLKHLGEQGAGSIIKAAVSISAPIKLAHCSTRLDSGLSRLYRNQLISELKEYVALKIRYLRSEGFKSDAERLEALGSLDTVRSFWEYDDRVVARLYGFESAADYYAKSSSFQFLKTIARPTLIIQALDDPFLTPAVLPRIGEHAACVSVEASPKGGHVGFVSGDFPWSPRYWVEERVVRYLTANQTTSCSLPDYSSHTLAKMHS